MITHPPAPPKSRGLDAQEVKAAAAGRWPAILSALAGLGEEYQTTSHGPCPRCFGSDRYRAFDDFDATGAVYCNQCHAKDNADGFETLKWLLGIDFPSAVAKVGEYLGMGPARSERPSLPAPSVPPPSKEFEPKPWSNALLPYFQAKRPGISEAAFITCDAKIGRHWSRTVFALPVDTFGNGKAGWVLADAMGDLLPVKDGEPVKYKTTAGTKCGLVGSKAGLERIRRKDAKGFPVCVVEGVSDLLALLSALPADDPTIVVTSSGGAKHFPTWMAQAIAESGAEVVTVIHDADKPGQEGAASKCKLLAAAGVKAINRQLPYEVTSDSGKDLRDWLLEGHTPADLTKLSCENGVYEAAEVADEPGRAPIRICTFGELEVEHPALRPIVIDGLLREGETMNVVSNSKGGKSWFVHGLALAVVCGYRWLERFKVSAGPVLLIDNELHPETLRYRIHTVADGMRVDREQARQQLHLVSLRGDLRSLSELEADLAAIERGAYKLIILDAKYRFAEKGESENDNSTEARFYNRVDALASRTGAAVVLVHHASKGDQGGKSITDVGAGAGAQSRAVDCHLTMRQHMEENAVSLQAVCRSFPPPDPVALRWEHPLWVPAPELDPTELKPASGTNEAKAAQSRQEALVRVRGYLTADAGWLTVSAMEKLSKADRYPKGMGHERIEGALRTLLEDNEIEARKAIKGGRDTMEYQHSVGGPLESAGGPTDYAADGGPLVRPLSPKGDTADDQRQPLSGTEGW